jgi:hypothetical protein
MNSQKSIRLIVGISISIGLLHFLIGPDYRGPFRNFITGYLIDILLPMNTYLLGQLPLRKIFSVSKSRVVASLGTFTFGAVVEYLQYLGMDFLGKTYDPLDLLMYALGVGLGIMIDCLLLDRWEKGCGGSSFAEM